LLAEILNFQGTNPILGMGSLSNLPKNEDSRQLQCPEDKESAIVEALKHFKMNS
jgi:hypothetical protein